MPFSNTLTPIQYFPLLSQFKCLEFQPPSLLVLLFYIKKPFLWSHSNPLNPILTLLLPLSLKYILGFSLLKVCWRKNCSLYKIVKDRVSEWGQHPPSLGNPSWHVWSYLSYKIGRKEGRKCSKQGREKKAIEKGMDKYRDNPKIEKKIRPILYLLSVLLEQENRSN